ncbi:MAG: hypothetical protein JSS66_06590 [Armatimonadetes bacterium]|nr:hypothetical protein [Armatimonadota bacterium]
MSDARVVMQKMKAAGHIHHYEEKYAGVEQAKQRDFLVSFDNGAEEPVHVEVKSERWQFINLALELVHNVGQQTPGKHIQFENDYFLHYMKADNLACVFDCKPVRDSVLSELYDRREEFLPTEKTTVTWRGQKLKLTYPKTYKAGKYLHTTCTLVAPKELVEEQTTHWRVYQFDA